MWKGGLDYPMGREEAVFKRHEYSGMRVISMIVSFKLIDESKYMLCAEFIF